MSYHYFKGYNSEWCWHSKAAQRPSDKTDKKRRLIIIFFFIINILLIVSMFTLWAEAQITHVEECAERCSPWRVWSWHPCTCLDDDGDT